MQEQKIHEEAGRRASTGSLWPRILPATAASKQQQQASATNKKVDFIIPQVTYSKLCYNVVVVRLF